LEWRRVNVRTGGVEMRDERDAMRDEEVWKEYVEWREEQYRKAERREIYWDEFERAWSERLWKVAGEVRKEERRKLCERVEKVLQKLFSAIEEVQEISDMVWRDKLLRITGRGVYCDEVRMEIDGAIGDAILWLATLANGIPEWEQRTLEWKERWERRGGKFKSFPL